MRHPFYTLPLLLVTAMAAVSAAHAEDFVARDIRVDGLVRLSPATVYGLLPVSVGDHIDDTRLAAALRALYASGNFDDVQASRQDDTLLVHVVERPVIGTITLEGNKLIPEDTLKKGFKSIGINEGDVLKRAVLQSIESDLEQQYAQQGRYDADVQIEEIPRPNNRVDLKFRFIEGTASRVVDIRVVGNTVFNDKDLREAFAVKQSSWTSILTRDDRYARERLSASLESLRAMYLNKGYIHFAINNAQINLSEDKKNVFVEISISEGQQYHFGDVKFLGDPLFETAELSQLAIFKAGQVYSQAQVSATRELLSRKYGNSGYYFAEINPVPEIDEASKTVAMSYFINPNQKVYVRRINFTGNTKTADDVLRRELRQMEGALASNEKIDLSKIRLERTGYFKTVTVDTQRVPNVSDQVDVNISVEEQSSGTSTIAVGYSQSGGITFQLGLNQTNFLGTGNRVSLDLSRSETLDNYNVSVLDPFFTIDGISRGYNGYYRKTKQDSLSVQRYTLDSFGGGVSFGYPVDENTDVSLSLGVDDTTLTTGSFVSQVAREYMLANGGKAIGSSTGVYEADFLTYNINLSWVYSTLNRPVFPNRGMQHRVSLDVALPSSDIQYQRLTYDGQMLFPINDQFVVRTYGKLGYGHDLPFYKNYFAGGYGSVRGYRNDTLGPRSPAATYVDAKTTDPDPESVGGNALIQGGAELVLPLPFRGEWTKQIRPVLFAEGGQVFDTTADNFAIHNKDFRFSAGIGFTWITMLGPLSLSYAYPINDQDGDKLKRVQFEIGRLY
jgi:outer membrane protein insertion porin family